MCMKWLNFSQLSPYFWEIVKDVRTRISLFVAVLGLSSSKVGRAAMLIGDMDISRLIVYVEQVKEEELTDMEEFRNKKDRSRNESR